MDNDDYKVHLHQNIDLLKEFEIKLQESMLNLMMHGEMMDWNKEAKEGDEIIITNDLLEACEDEKVQQLLKLHKVIKQVISQSE